MCGPRVKADGNGYLLSGWILKLHEARDSQGMGGAVGIC